MACVYTYNGKDYSEKEFKALLIDMHTKGENLESLIGKFTPPPKDGDIDFDSGKGETRKASRAKRIEAQEAYRDKLDHYTKTYESVSVENVNALIDDYMPNYYADVAENGVEAANRNAIDFFLSLIRQDVGQEGALTRSAFAVLASQRIAAEALMREDVDTLTAMNDFLDLVGRQGGTLSALQNSKISNDPLLNLISNIFKAQEKSMKTKTKSGRTKKEVVDELQKEVQDVRSKAADELSKDESLANDITTVTTKNAPKERKVSISKRTELNKRKQAALEKLKQIKDSSVGFAQSSKDAANKSGEFAEALVELAKVNIQLGAYTLSEAIAKVYKDVKGFMTKDQVRDTLTSVWESDLKKLSDEARQEEAMEILSTAIEGGSSDAIIKALGKAMRVVNPDFIKAQKKGRRITDKQAIDEILKDKDKAEQLINSALEYLRQQISIEGKYLDTVKAKKPASMSQEQWDALRAKYVFSKLKNLVDNIIGKTQEKAEQMLKDEWLAAKETYEQKREAIRNKEEQKELERIAKKELEDAEKALKEVEAARKRKEADDEAVRKAYEKREAAKEKQRLLLDEKERQKLEQKLIDEAEKELKEAQKLYDKKINQIVNKVAQKFYKENTNTQSLAEALIDEMPSLSIDEALEIAALVEKRMEVLVERMDNRRIKNLVKEITDGKDEADLNKVIAKVMWNRGAMGSTQFANMLSSFLGMKGIPQNVINQLMTMFRQVSNMPSGLARQMAMKNINNLTRLYGETGWSFFNDVIKELLVRNTLSSTKTGFSGGLSVMLSYIPNILFSAVTRPVKTFRAAKVLFMNFKSGRYAFGSATKEIFMQHNVPIARELPRQENPYSVDRAWVRARNTKWKEIGGIWKNNKGKAISVAVAKALINFNLQGKYIGVTNTVNSVMSFLDYFAITTLRDMYTAIDVQRKIDAENAGLSKSEKFDELLKLMAIDSQTISQIETIVDGEIAQMTTNGQPIPKGYRNKRIQQLVTEAQPTEVIQKSHEKALQATLMGEPTTFIGSSVYAFFTKIKTLGKPKIDGQLSITGFAMQMLTFPLTLFDRIAIVMAEKGIKYSLPYANILINAVPYEWRLKDGMPALRRNEDGSIYLKTKEDLRGYSTRLLAASTLSAIITMFLSYAFDDEEVVDPKTGKPIVDPRTGKPYVRQKYNLEGVIDFYGNDPEIRANQKGTVPRNTVRMYGKDYPMEAFPPYFYPTFKMLGYIRDKQRYSNEKLEKAIVDGKVQTVLDHQNFDMVDVVSVTAGQAFNLDFTALGRIGNGISAGRGEQAVFEAMLVDPAKRLVSPRQAEDVAKQLQELMGQRKAYIDYNLKDPESEPIIAYLMKDVWFLDPFIQDREKYESVDPFGKKFDFPPMYDNFWGMFGTSTTYSMSNHEEKYQKYYNLFKDEKGKYNPDVAPLPKRFIYSNVTELQGDERVKSTVSAELRRIISDRAYVNFGESIDKRGIKTLQDMDYEDRMDELGYLWDKSRYEAVKEVFPNSTIKEPKKKKSFATKEDKEASNANSLKNAEVYELK